MARAAEHVAHHVLQVDADLLDRAAGDDLERRHRRRLHVELDDALVEPALAELFAHPLARAAGLLAPGGLILAGHRRPRRRQQQIEQPLLGGRARLVLDLVALLRADHVHGELDEIADHRLDVAADVADFGELRRLDLDERRMREPRQPARDLGLADAGRPDHQDVLRRDFFGHLAREPLTPHAVAQRDRDGALGLGLADDVLVQLGDDLARGQRADGASSCVREEKWPWPRVLRW